MSVSSKKCLSLVTIIALLSLAKMACKASPNATFLCLQRIAASFGFKKDLIKPISLDDFSFEAKRGKKLSLNVDKLQKALCYKLPTITYCIEAFYRDYERGLPGEIKGR